MDFSIVGEFLERNGSLFKHPWFSQLFVAHLHPLEAGRSLVVCNVQVLCLS